jgi:hypothetical protein
MQNSGADARERLGQLGALIALDEQLLDHLKAVRAAAAEKRLGSSAQKTRWNRLHEDSGQCLKDTETRLDTLRKERNHLLEQGKPKSAASDSPRRPSPLPVPRAETTKIPAEVSTVSPFPEVPARGLDSDEGLKRLSPEELIQVHAEMEDHVRHLEKQQQENAVAIAHIRELLEKADARRVVAGEDPRKWDRVIDNLERSLAEMRGRQEACEVELRRIRRRHEHLHLYSTFDLDSAGAAPTLLDPADSFEISRDILTMSAEELGKLSLDEVEMLHNQVATENIAAALADVEALVDQLDLVASGPQNSAVTETALGTAVPSPRHDALRSAIEKISANRISSLTAEESRLVMASYHQLTRNLKQTPKDDRLRRILGAAVKVLRRRQAEEQRAREGSPPPPNDVP